MTILVACLLFAVGLNALHAAFNPTITAPYIRFQFTHGKVLVAGIGFAFCLLALAVLIHG